MTTQALRATRMYWAIVNPDRIRRTPGRDGIKLVAKPIRVPVDIGEELDLIISGWEIRCDSTSPRYHFARELLAELKEALPKAP